MSTWNEDQTYIVPVGPCRWCCSCIPFCSFFIQTLLETSNCRPCRDCCPCLVPEEWCKYMNVLAAYTPFPDGLDVIQPITNDEYQKRLIAGYQNVSARGSWLLTVLVEIYCWMFIMSFIGAGLIVPHYVAIMHYFAGGGPDHNHFPLWYTCYDLSEECTYSEPGTVIPNDECQGVAMYTVYTTS